MVFSTHHRYRKIPTWVTLWKWGRCFPQPPSSEVPFTPHELYIFAHIFFFYTMLSVTIKVLKKAQWSRFVGNLFSKCKMQFEQQQVTPFPRTTHYFLRYLSIGMIGNPNVVWFSTETNMKNHSTISIIHSRHGDLHFLHNQDILENERPIRPFATVSNSELPEWSHRPKLITFNVLPLCSDVTLHWLFDPAPLIPLPCVYRWQPLIPLPGTATTYWVCRAMVQTVPFSM